MTENQIKYLTLQETNRNNIVVSDQTARRDAETARANKAREALTQAQNEETGRHNVTSENLIAEQNRETGRHNIATEKQAEKDRKTRITVANTQAAASRYGADKSAAATKSAAKTAAAASKQNAATAAAASRYGADKSAEASKYQTDANKAIARARNIVDKAISREKNLTSKEVAQIKTDMDQLIASANNRLKEKDLTLKEQKQLQDYKASLLKIQADIGTRMTAAQMQLLGSLVGGLKVPNSLVEDGKSIKGWKGTGYYE